MRMRRSVSGVVASVLVFCHVASAETTVVVRRGQQAPAGVATAVNGQGVMFTQAEGDAVLLRWDQVASVEGDLRDASEPHARVRDLAWRGRTRIERGDLGGAEPLLDSVRQALGDDTGPLTRMVSSGLLRCRLARHAQAASVRAWLDVLRSDEGEFVFEFGEASGEQVMRVVDEEYGLASALPPLWVRSPALHVVASADEGADRSTASGTVAVLYALSAKATLGQGVRLPERPKDDAKGAALVWDVVAATAGSSEQRGVAMTNLRARLADSSDRPWIEAWTRVALGRALLEDPEVDAQRRGVLHLLHVPARFGHDYPFLAGAALLDVAAWLEQQGRFAEARRVWDEAHQRFGFAVDVGAPPASAVAEPAPGAS